MSQLVVVCVFERRRVGEARFQTTATLCTSCGSLGPLWMPCFLFFLSFSFFNSAALVVRGECLFGAWWRKINYVETCSVWLESCGIRRSVA